MSDARCNRLRCPLARFSGLQCFNMGHSGHGINLYGVVMTLMGNLHTGGQSNLGYLSLVQRHGLCDLGHVIIFTVLMTCLFR